MCGGGCTDDDRGGGDSAGCAGGSAASAAAQAAGVPPALSGGPGMRGWRSHNGQLESRDTRGPQVAAADFADREEQALAVRACGPPVRVREPPRARLGDDLTHRSGSNREYL